MTSVTELQQEQERLEDAHADVMDQLYRALASDDGAVPWERLSFDERSEIVSAAHELCEEWALLPDLRATPEALLSPAMRLVAKQHRIVEQMLAAEDRLISAIGRAAWVQKTVH